MLVTIPRQQIRDILQYSEFYIVQVTKKQFYKMYNNVGMASREKQPKHQERDDIRFIHIAIPTSF